MNEKDKEAVKAAKGTSPHKVPKSRSQQSAQTGGEHIQQQLKTQAEQVGIVLADNFQAQALMTMIQSLESGTYGPKTTAILEAIASGTRSPLECWSNEIQAWHEPPLLAAAAESNG